jgi:hypothetical protein
MSFDEPYQEIPLVVLKFDPTIHGLPKVQVVCQFTPSWVAAVDQLDSRPEDGPRNQRRRDYASGVNDKARADQAWRWW